MSDMQQGNGNHTTAGQGAVASPLAQAADISLVDVAGLPAEVKPRVGEVARAINIEDRQAVLQYGIGAQRRISDFAETILTEIRTKDGGHAGELLTGLVSTVKEVDVDSLTSEPGVFGKMFGGMKKRIEKFLQRYESLATQIDKVVRELEQARMNLLRDVAMLDEFYQKNQEHLQDLDVYIAAGKMKLEELRTTVLPEMEKHALESGDPLEAQKVQDFNQLLAAFEKKLHDMQLSRMIAIQTAPQVRLIQNNNEMLVEKIQNSILTTIPLWKSQVVIAVSLYRQGKAMQLQREVTNTTNEMLKRNSQLLKQGSIEVARESERGIVEIETLQKVNTDLISTIEETLQIQREGREKRIAAEGQLRVMEDDLKQRLMQISAE